MLKFIAVFIGGGIGAILRHFMCSFMKCQMAYSTLFVNFLGSFILGFVFYYFTQRLHLPEELRLLLTVGFCGGLTTFSTFALENYHFLSQGEVVKSLAYIVLSVVLTIVAVVLGVYFAKQF